MNLHGNPDLERLPCPKGLMCGGRNTAKMTDIRLSAKKGNFCVRFTCTNCGEATEVAMGSEQWNRYQHLNHILFPKIKQYMMVIQHNYRALTNENFSFEF